MSILNIRESTKMTAGRKRSFDKQDALDKAMFLFWENGYSSTSLSDLTSTLGINKPSLYAAFGNKESLFEASLEHYLNNHCIPVLQKFESLREMPLEGRLKTFLFDLIDLTISSKTPKGCFYINSIVESGSRGFPQPLSVLLKNTGKENLKLMTKVLEAERTFGQLPDHADLKGIASYLLSLMYGISVHASSGQTKKSLRVVAEFAVETFPYNA